MRVGAAQGDRDVCSSIERWIVMEAYPVGHLKSGDHCDDSSRFALCKGVIRYATVSGPVLSNLRMEHTGFEMAPSFRFG